MARPDDDFPELPDLPTFSVEGEPVVEPGTDLEATDEPAPESGHGADRHAGTGLVRHTVAIPAELIDADAARVIRRLERSGFQAYLVGGCVRDLLLGSKPKDFDIATSARPEDVREIFRNCRVIGRRFRLAHVLFGGGKIIEVATFRRNPAVEAPEDEFDSSEQILIRNDNVFGEAHEDSRRRDFTINALFYDLQRREVLDWAGGMEDLRRRVIRTIGEPAVRFREDPIRILRAIKFAARLDLGISPEVYDAMVMCREDLAKAARPRLFEEVLRLLRGGAAQRSFFLTWESGGLAVFLPEVAAFLDDQDATHGAGQRFWKRLAIIDEMTRERGAALDDLVLCTGLLQDPVEEAIAGDRDRMRAAGDFLDQLLEQIAIPRRITDGVRRTMALLPRLAALKPARLMQNELFPLWVDVLEIDLRTNNRDLSPAEALRAHIPSRTPRPRRDTRRPRRGPRPSR